MKIISDIIHNAIAGRSKYIEPLIKQHLPKGSMYKALYEIVTKNKSATDHYVKDRLGYSGTGSSFTMLKKRLTTKLYNIILLLHPKIEENSHYINEVIYCNKFYVVAKVLLYAGANTAALPLMKKVLHRALRIEQHDVVLFCAMHLRRQCLYAADRKGYKTYEELLQRTYLKIRAEAKVEAIYDQFISQYIKSKAKKLHLLFDLQKAISRINHYLIEHPTIEIKSRHFRLVAIQYEITGQYPKLLKLAEEENQHLLSHNHLWSSSRAAHVLQYKTKCHLHIGSFDEGIICGKKALAMYPQGSPNWFSVHEYLFLLFLNNGLLRQALNTYIQATSSNKYNGLRPWQQETWRIFRGYLWLSIKLYNDKRFSKKKEWHEEKLHIAKLMNEVPVYSRDKQGAYVSLVVLQFMVLLSEQRYEEIYDKIDALTIYLNRRLRTKEDIRNRLFVKMLLLLPRYNFVKHNFKPEAEKYLTQLQKPSSHAYADLQIEVIRYEKQWEFALSLCQ